MFARIAANFTIAMAALLPLNLAAACIDSDGDGWGWDGTASCKPTVQPESNCIDTPPEGDGWGWDGSQSCRIDVTPTSSICIDSPPLGNGWGWNGTESCRVQVVASNCIDTPPTGDGWGWNGEASCRLTVTESVCIDTPPSGDGWGWNGTASCRIDAQPGGVARLPSGGHVSNPEFQWKADGAYDYRLVIEDSHNNKITQELSAAQAGCQSGSGACQFVPSVQIHDSILKWKIESYDAAGVLFNTSSNVSYNTLRSLLTQPYTDRDNIGAPPNPGFGFPTIEFDKYIVLNNAWNARAMNRDDWTQTVEVNRLKNGTPQIKFDYDWLRKDDGGEFDVKSYPQVLYGNKLGAHVSAGSKQEIGLPETIANLDEFKIQYRLRETGNAERNLAFESFFHSSCDIGGPNFDVDNREFEMMVWIASPSIRTPGSTKAVSGVMIDNQLWDVWIKPQQDDKYIAFTAQVENKQATLNWKRFVDWTVNWTRDNQSTGIKALNTNWCMSAIEFGVETWWGEGSLTIDEFNITKQ